MSAVKNEPSSAANADQGGGKGGGIPPAESGDARKETARRPSNGRPVQVRELAG